MDLMRLVRSLEEFLYAVMTWLIFYPRTLWRIVRRPLEIAQAVKLELAKPSEEQFGDLLSPPLFLVLSIFLVHMAELGFNQAPDTASLSPMAREVMGSEQLLLLFRAIVYSLFPLLMASSLLRRKGVPVDRETLRAPFFVQCYFVVPLVICEAAAILMARVDAADLSVPAAALLISGVVWFLWVQNNWFRAELGIAKIRALGITLMLMLGATLLGLAFAAALMAGRLTEGS